MSNNFSKQLIPLIVQKSTFILYLLEEISLKNFPSENPEVLINIIKKICLALRNHTINKGADESNLNSEETEQELKLILYMLLRIASHIRFIEGASDERTPWNLIQPFENLSSEIHPAPILLRPQWHYNFTIRRHLLHEYRESLENILPVSLCQEIFRDAPAELYVISFPSFEKSNILLQSVLGHELGHPFATDFLNQEDEAYLEDIRDEVEKTLTEEDPLKRASQKSSTVNIIKKVRNSGLSEIISDMIAVRLFSYAAIFSAYEIAIMLSMDNVSIQGRDYVYPPWKYRIRQMINELNWDALDQEMNNITKNNESYKAPYAAIKQKINSLQELVGDTADIDEINKNPHFKIAYESINKALPNVKDYLGIQKVYSELPDLKDSIEKILYLCQRVTFNLPPNAVETNRPFNPQVSDIREIINAGWLYKITYISDTLTVDNYKETYIEKIDLLNRLIFKALELSEVCTLYKKKTIEE